MAGEKSFNHFMQAGTGLQAAVKAVVKKTAFDIQAQAASAAPRDTGFLANSIYTVTNTSSNYGKSNKFTVKGRFVSESAELLPEIERPEDAYTAYVAVGANYGVYVEFGTRYMSAQPYFFQAVEDVGDKFDTAMEKIKDKLEEIAYGGS